jgi:hypothetical protein
VDRRTPTASELVRRAVEICDRDGRDRHGDPPNYVADWLGEDWP